MSYKDKARVPLGLPVSKKQTTILMHLEYKVMLLNYDFLMGKNINLLLLFMLLV